jgi:predicted esterase
MSTLLNYKYYFEQGNSDYTLLGLSGSSPDFRSNIGAEFFSLERIIRIRKFSKNKRFNLLAVSGERVSGSNIGNLSKPNMEMRLAEFKSFLDAVTEKQKIDPKKLVVVGITDSAIFLFNFAIKYPGLLSTIILINPTQEFYFYVEKFYANYFGDKKLPLSRTNLFIYHKEPRYSQDQYKSSELKNIQRKIIKAMLEDRLAKAFFIHFKKEDQTNYKTNILKFIDSPFSGQTKESLFRVA